MWYLVIQLCVMSPALGCESTQEEIFLSMEPVEMPKRVEFATEADCLYLGRNVAAGRRMLENNPERVWTAVCRKA